ncbi:MAG: SUMF1/EgtB/PvdO family nonheme iron enzyme [Mariprofundus sp.]|nr:SUMF1/EgtB/PvdO family nonheme iron enzyme [Mariprofundus sp.]
MHQSEGEQGLAAKTEESTHDDNMIAALSRAKSEQKKLYVWLSLALLITALSVFIVFVFSKASMIEVEPKQARDQAVLELVDGLGMVLGKAVYVLSQQVNIKVSSPGFKTIQKTIESDQMGTLIKLELTALPAQLHIKTTTNEKNSQWFVDGKRMMLGAEFKQALAAGPHMIEIDNPYYQKKEIPLNVQRGQQLTMTVTLQAIVGQLHLNTVPSGATIRINGTLEGVSPRILSKNGGSYQLEISHRHYQNISETINITHDEKMIERNYHLALKKASLQVDVAPKGGRLLLDGKVISPGIILRLKSGKTHRLSYALAGYRSQYKRLSVQAQAEHHLYFHLKAALGTVQIRSTPASKVEIDGKVVGKTPFETTLLAIPHQLKLSRKGYRSYQKLFTPNAHAAQVIKVNLVTDRAAAIAASPANMKNSLGIALKLFEPNELFAMGAPRSEIGQRANEFLRTVKLNRAFYISTHEITLAQYAQFRTVSAGLKKPVTSISWIEAALYCNWLSKRENMVPFYRISHHRLQGFNRASTAYRLPSEAEWEWLARKASKKQETRFTWGDSTTVPLHAGNIADEYAKGSVAQYVPNYTDGYAALAPVGSFAAEVMGLYDMTGNVSEWVHDVYQLLAAEKTTLEHNPLGLGQGDMHTVKGSNYRSASITELRASYREGEKVGRDDIGFRVARYVHGG